MTGGNGMDMLGNFFGNLGKGNVSGLGIFGLLLLPCWYSDASVGLERLPGRYWA